MADLRTDYKDDVLNINTNERRKYRMINNADGTVSFEDVTDYVQNGDSFGSTDVNAITERVNRSLTSADVVDNLESTATNLPLSANMGRELNDKMTHSEYVLMQQYTQTGNYAMDFSQYKKIAISLAATNVYADTRIFDVDLITSGCLGAFTNTILAGTVLNSDYHAASVFVIKRNQLEIKLLSSPQTNCSLSVYGIK